jgi:hypothetical protein
MVCGRDLIDAIQSELPIPASQSELPLTGILGICVNLITIVHNYEEDPIEVILRVLSEEGLNFICFPEAYDRDTERLKEKEHSYLDVSVHRF